jgi:hypothetical protein
VVTARGWRPGWIGADGGWRGPVEGIGGTKPIWGEVVWRSGFEMAGVRRAGAALRRLRP